MRNYYYAKNGERLGPFTLEEMQKKDLDNDTLVWYEGLEDWIKISNDKELSALIKNIPPPLRKSGVKNISLSITAIAIVAILILFGSFYFYPKWNNQKRFNAALNIFMSTDSIQFNEFNYLANKDIEEASYILGLYYQRTDDSIKAKDSFEKALNSKKRIPALYGLLDVNYKDSSAYLKTISEEFQDWLNQIDAKDWLSQRSAAKMFVSGKGTSINYIKAKEYYEKSINNGSISSKILLGNLLSKDGNLKDEAKALELYKSAANLGNPHAMSATGFVYYEGAGVKVDYEEAKKWFWQAAKNNSIYGELYLGLLYMSGDGGKKNYDSAKYWFERAASNRLDKSETSKDAKKVAQPMVAFVEIMKSASTNSNQTRAVTSRSGGSYSYNENNTYKPTSAQLRVTPADLCDNGYSFKDKSVTFNGYYTYAEQVGDKWSLKSQGVDYEKINSAIAYGLTNNNDNLYTRIIWADCKLILRIPFNITVPNSDQGFFAFTGKVTLIGKSYVMLEVESIRRI